MEPNIQCRAVAGGVGDGARPSESRAATSGETSTLAAGLLAMHGWLAFLGNPWALACSVFGTRRACRAWTFDVRRPRFGTGTSAVDYRLRPARLDMVRGQRCQSGQRRWWSRGRRRKAGWPLLHPLSGTRAVALPAPHRQRGDPQRGSHALGPQAPAQPRRARKIAPKLNIRAGDGFSAMSKPSLGRILARAGGRSDGARGPL